RDAPPGDLRALDSETLGEVGELRAAAVDDDEADSHLIEERDVLGDAVEDVLLLRELATQLDDEDLVSVALDIGQRLLEDLDVLQRRLPSPAIVPRALALRDRPKSGP